MTLLGWFVLSNHCALGRMASRTEAHGCCHQGASQPAKAPMDGQPGMQCCKALSALLPDAAKLPAASSLEADVLPVAWLVVALLALPEPAVATPSHGPPPDVPAFAELVLHRSLRSHAPPFRA